MSHTDVEALIKLYSELGGDVEDVANETTTVEMLKKLYTLLGGDKDISKINTSSDMIGLLVEVATSGGSGSSDNGVAVFDEDIDVYTIVNTAITNQEYRDEQTNGGTSYRHYKIATIPDIDFSADNALIVWKEEGMNAGRFEYMDGTESYHYTIPAYGANNMCVFSDDIHSLYINGYAVDALANNNITHITILSI